MMIVLMMASSCSSQEAKKEMAKASQKPAETKKQHQYGGWYCPDNFGFVPVDISELEEVPAIENRLPTKEELAQHMSLIEVDTIEFPDARALEMELPRVARVVVDHKGTTELIIVIQAIVVNGDTVVGYRFPSGGNGSAWYRDVTFLSKEEVAQMGAQPYYFSRKTLKANSKEIWDAIGSSSYGAELVDKFDKKELFTSNWDSVSHVKVSMQSPFENARGYAGMVFGNLYMQIDYERSGFQSTEKLLLLENAEEGTTELIFASGPFPHDYDKHRLAWDAWMENVGSAVR